MHISSMCTINQQILKTVGGSIRALLASARTLLHHFNNRNFLLENPVNKKLKLIKTSLIIIN